ITDNLWMVVLRVFKHSPILSPLCQFELHRWAALGLRHVEGAIRTAFDSQKLKGNCPTTGNCPGNSEHHAARRLNPVLFNLGFAHGSLPPSGQPSEIRQRLLALRRQTEATGGEDQ